MINLLFQRRPWMVKSLMILLFRGENQTSGKTFPLFWNVRYRYHSGYILLQLALLRTHILPTVLIINTMTCPQSLACVFASSLFPSLHTQTCARAKRWQCSQNKPFMGQVNVRYYFRVPVCSRATYRSLSPGETKVIPQPLDRFPRPKARIGRGSWNQSWQIPCRVCTLFL